eukprot:gene37322-4517_t
MLRSAAAVVAMAVGCSAGIDPTYARNSAGAIPVNMDTGDAAGDLYFYLGEFLLPLECAQESPGMEGFDCSNPDHATPHHGGCVAERVGTDLVVTKVEMEPCEVGSYVCDHFSHHSSSGFDPTKARFSHGICQWCVYQHRSELQRDGCTDADLEGYGGTNGHGTRHTPYGHTCSPQSKDWECWRSNITVAETCLRDHLATKVEAQAHDCFAGCGARNMSSPCWIGCFFDTLLGKGARDSCSTPLNGMSVTDVVSSWTGAFLPEANGGCPQLPKVGVAHGTCGGRCSTDADCPGSCHRCVQDSRFTASCQP